MSDFFPEVLPASSFFPPRIRLSRKNIIEHTRVKHREFACTFIYLCFTNPKQFGVAMLSNNVSIKYHCFLIHLMSQKLCQCIKVCLADWKYRVLLGSIAKNYCIGKNNDWISFVLLQASLAVLPAASLIDTSLLLHTDFHVSLRHFPVDKY